MSELPEKIVSIIPYFFYDLFGRIIPGLYLFCGLVLEFRASDQLHGFLLQVHDARITEWILGSWLILVASFVAGILLSVFSRRLWHSVPFVTLEELRGHFGSGADTESALEKAFFQYFGFSLNQKDFKKKYIVYCSRICHHAVASRHSILDTVMVRIEAEELLSRSLTIANIALFIVSVCRLLFLNLWRSEWIPAAAFLILAVVSFESFRHYHPKAVRERFQMFLVLCRQQTEDHQ
jgi:hypothetical protein